MSWWVYLEENGEPVKVPIHEEGGTYAVGGVDLAELDVTYNYGKHYPLRELLHGRKASDAIPEMEALVAKLGTERAADYWEPTPGNAGAALATLLGWARLRPDAVFRVS